ncbi:hypothetical protein OUZ56_006486 [Daphnia magna]|uniref:Uncharacterized protein n=1 Tax=Daphnia magna TaxID=35525 RepID=A0ABQ9YVT1_9CRUS|nr:hypothetical protein OUZ56_006486 [Daphnia magna]
MYRENQSTIAVSHVQQFEVKTMNDLAGSYRLPFIFTADGDWRVAEFCVILRVWQIAITS